MHLPVFLLNVGHLFSGPFVVGADHLVRKDVIAEVLVASKDILVHEKVFKDWPGRGAHLGSLGLFLFSLSIAAHWTTLLLRPLKIIR